MSPRCLARSQGADPCRSEDELSSGFDFRRLQAHRRCELRLSQRRPADGRFRGGAERTRSARRRRNHRHRGQRKRRAASDRDRGRATLWAFPTRSPRHFYRTTSTRPWKTRSRNWRRSKRRRMKPGTGLSYTSPWPLAIPTAIRWSADEVVEALGLLEMQEIRTISLADTVGVAPPEKIREVVSA